uniref:Uncharacterized protein n=1 Tax=Arundo donax TaxID=35708 RepID=A0A0A9FNL5_ARUDO
MPALQLTTCFQLTKVNNGSYSPFPNLYNTILKR